MVEVEEKEEVGLVERAIQRVTGEEDHEVVKKLRKSSE